jgi:glycosyltransferase involved in cell wall biosynthesis
MGSVSQIGWEWYSRLARHTPVTLVTHIRNQNALTEAGAPLPGSEVHFIDTEWFAGPLYRLASRIFPRSQHSTFLVSSLDYFVYDRDAVNLLRKMGPRDRWDIVHAVTPVSPSGATRLHKLGLPVVLGPWNGGLGAPAGFPEIMKDESGWIYRVRDIGRLLDRIFGTTRSAAAILSATRATDAAIGAAYHDRVIRMTENGVNLDLFRTAIWDPPPSATSPLRVLFVGRLIPFKGVAMLLEAVRRCRAEFPVELTIIGDGPLRQELTVLARTLGIERNAHFRGEMPLRQVAGEMRLSHVFCLPSIRESGGAVLLEAMAASLPSVAADYGGPAELVDDEVGRLVSVAGAEALTAGLVEAFRDIVRNPDEWRARGAAGRARAERLYSWEAKIDTALQLYSRIIAGASHA